MLHGQVSQSDSSAPGFGTQETSATASRVAASAQDATPGKILIPDTELMFSAKYAQQGSDLVLTGADGRKLVVSGYFDQEQHADLVAPGGATLSAEVVAKLTVSQAHGQYAQAGAPAGALAIGKVERLGGSATVQHANGTVEELKIGDTILQGDVVETRDGSLVGMSFTDGTAFNMGASARMVMSELVYDAGSNSNSAVFSLVKGSITFVAGQAAKTGDMRIETPVATMGIRGTSVNTSITTDVNGNAVSVTYSLMTDPDGHIGSFNLIDKATGAIIGTITAVDSVMIITPSANLGILATQLNKTPEQVQQELAIAQVLFPIFLGNPTNFIQTPQAPSPNDVQPQGIKHGSGGYLDYQGHAGSLGDVTGMGASGGSGYETVTTTYTGPDGNAHTSTQIVPIVFPANFDPLIHADSAPHLIEAAGFNFGVRTSTAQLIKSDVDGVASYDTAALLANNWIDLGHGVYGKLGSYGAAAINTQGVTASDLTSSGWFNVGNGVYQKVGVDFGGGNFETVRVTLSGDTLTYALDNAKADALGAGDHPAENFTIPVVDDHGVHAATTATFTIDGTNDAPDITTGFGPVALYSMAENTRYITTVKADDAEGSVVTYALAPGFLDAGLLKIDPATGVLEFQLLPDYEAPGGFLNNNIYIAAVTASDGNGGVATQLVTIQVDNIQNEQTGSSANNIMTGILNRTNYLSGLGGNDTLTGRNRDDVLSGGTGDDQLTGGGGRDTFIFNSGFGKDTITDFNTATDVIEIANTLFADFAALLAHTADVSGHAVITFDAGNTITLNSVVKAALTQSDFHFV